MCLKIKKRILIDLYEWYNSVFIIFFNINSILKFFLISNYYVCEKLYKEYIFYDIFILFGKLIIVIML